MNSYGNCCLLFSLFIIFQIGYATVVITETATNDASSANNETASASSCYCNCAPVITVSCPAAPPSCPTTIDPPITHPTVTDPITSTTSSIMSSTENPPGTEPLTTSSTSTVTIITDSSTPTAGSTRSTMSETTPSTDISTSSTTSATSSTTSSLTSTTTLTYSPSSIMSTTDPSSTPTDISTSPSISPITYPLTTAGSGPTVTIISGPTTSTFTSSGSTIMSVTSPSTNTSTSSTTSATSSTPVSPSSLTMSTYPDSTVTGMTSTSSNITASTTPASSSSTILTTPASTSPPSTANSTSAQQSSTITTGDGTSSTTPSSKNCSSVLYSDSGWFTSPNYPNNYDNNLNCNWLINVTDKIVLTFQSFNTEMAYDFVSVYDGPTTTSDRLLNASGSNIPPPISSSGGQMLITFKTDSSTVYKGFYANYTTTKTPTSTTSVGGSTKSTLSTDPDFTRPTTSGPILDNCQAILAGDSGTFSSPYYPQNYPNNANCSWIITANGRITITFHQFRTEINSDIVKIYDGPTTSYNRLLSASGTSIPSPVTSYYGGPVLITFFSDGSVNDIGFNASYSLYIPPTTTLPPYYYCGENITDVSSGFITSPKFPNGYPAYSRCTWIIQTAPGNRIQFHFTDFSTQSGDYVTVYNDKSCTDDRYSVIKQYGNVSSICGFVSYGNSLKITFNSGASSSTLYPGFRARFTTDHGCDGTLNNTNQGVIKSPGYDINGTFTYSCSWKLGVNQGSKLNFSMSEMMGLEPSMSFYEGYGKSYELASGRPTSSYFAVSRLNQVSLDMSYGSSCWSLCSCSTNSVCEAAGVNHGKWKGSYSATNGPTYGCHGSMNTETKTVTSPGYPSTYTQRNLRCNWKIEEPAGKKIQFTFPVPVSLYKGWYYDTLSFSSPPAPWTLTINGGTYNPAPMTIGSNETALVFSTSQYVDSYYNSSLYSGWKINWNAISSP